MFYVSFFFSLAANSITTILTLAYVVFGIGSELNPVMALELKAFGIWVIPVHIVLILAYYLLFYLTMKRTVMNDGRFKLWMAVLVLIPILSSFDPCFRSQKHLLVLGGSSLTNFTKDIRNGLFFILGFG